MTGSSMKGLRNNPVGRLILRMLQVHLKGKTTAATTLFHIKQIRGEEEGNGKEKENISRNPKL